MKYLNDDTIIEILLNGENISIIKNTDDKNQCNHVIKTIIPPGVSFKPLHFHDRIWEEIECIEGKINIICGKRKRSLLAGESIFIHKKTPHSYANTSSAPATILIKVENSEDYVKSYEILKNLQNNNGLNDNGIPKNIFHKVYINRLQNKRLTFPPLTVQKITTSTIYNLGKMLNAYKELE